jgi:beta-galactosidase
MGPGIAQELIAICHRLDPTRLVTSGNDEIASNTPATPEFLAAFENDIVGYNYPDRWRERKELMYAIDKKEFPNRRVVGTETGGYSGSRGSYMIPGLVPENASPAQGNAMAGMMSFMRRGGGLISSGLIDVERRWVFNKAYDYVIGDFMWTGIDYYGETRWPSRGAGSGYLDNCGFKKDGYWFFKSIWTQEPVLHIFPHWNWRGNEGKIMQVACFTNMEEVELFVNGKSYGKKSIEYPRRGVDISWAQYGPGKTFATTADLHLVWDVEYQPGEVKAVGVKNGVTYEEIIRTAGDPAQLRVTVDRESFLADPSDVAHLTVEVLDADGNLCPNADNLVRFNVKGARLIGVESGNMSDLGSVKASERKAYCGMLLGIVAADQPGDVSVEVTADGLKSSSVSFKAK